MVKSEPRIISDRHSRKRHREFHDKHKSEPRIKTKLMQLSRSPSPPSSSLSSQYSLQHSHSLSVSSSPPDSPAIPFTPPPSANLLRRTTAVHSLTAQDEDEKGKTTKEEAGKEVSAGEWILVKFNCQCSKENRFLVNATHKKYFKLV